MKRKEFLTAKWSNLIFINYEIDPELLNPFMPKGVQLDFYQGKCIVSVVAFEFKDTRLLRIPIPWYDYFPEINLRFYVKEYCEGQWIRGVVFIKELVSSPIIAAIAKSVYRENYQRYPIKISRKKRENEMEWTYRFQENEITLGAENREININVNSIAYFITEHYWGYTKVNEKTTYKYEVVHPSWTIRPILKHDVKINFPMTFGNRFYSLNDTKIHSLLVAKGSDIMIHKKQILISK